MNHQQMQLLPQVFIVCAILSSANVLHAAKLAEVAVIDRDYLMIHFLDGEVVHKDDGQGAHAFEAHGHEAGQDTVKLYDPALNTSAAVQAANWTLKSTDDTGYGPSGKNPAVCYRKSKVNGHAENEWAGSDYRYDYTYEHFIYLKLPSPLKQENSYTLEFAQSINSDTQSKAFTFDIFSSVSEALHVNLVGYHQDPSVKAADLYVWMGDGGARDYAAFEGNTVYLYDIGSGDTHEVGDVAFWKRSGQDVGWYNLTRSDVWNADIADFSTSGT
ncbi:MAG: hypothetical protein GF401_07895, partial [Chitinivibrionales bacterium]|nr:hypothetical protein [Chitinivibrionales bacterium]